MCVFSFGGYKILMIISLIEQLFIMTIYRFFCFCFFRFLFKQHYKNVYTMNWLICIFAWMAQQFVILKRKRRKYQN